MADPSKLPHRNAACSVVEDSHVVCKLVEDEDEVDAWGRFSDGDFRLLCNGLTCYNYSNRPESTVSGDNKDASQLAYHDAMPSVVWPSGVNKHPGSGTPGGRFMTCTDDEIIVPPTTPT